MGMVADVRLVTATRGEVYEPSDVSDSVLHVTGHGQKGPLPRPRTAHRPLCPARLQDSFALVDALEAAAPDWLGSPPRMCVFWGGVGGLESGGAGPLALRQSRWPARRTATPPFLPRSLLEIGVGSGYVSAALHALAVAAGCRSPALLAVDVSPPATRDAASTLAAHGCKGGVDLLLADLGRPLLPRLEGAVDVVVRERGRGGEGAPRPLPSTRLSQAVFTSFPTPHRLSTRHTSQPPTTR